MLTMRRRWSEERRKSRQEAEWIVAWLRDNGPASIRDIVNALNSAGRDVKAHVIRRALLKSQFVNTGLALEAPWKVPYIFSILEVSQLETSGLAFVAV